MLYDKRWEKPEVKIELWQQVLFDAADLLETEGWCQESYCNPSGQYCLVGAIRVVSGLLAEPGRVGALRSYAFNTAMNKLRYHLVCSNLEHWNDRSSRSKEQVIMVLREAAVS